MSNKREKSATTLRPADGRFLLQRRDFLRLSSVAIAGAATTAFADDAIRGVTSAFVSQPLPLLGIGYCDSSSASPHRVIAAERLASGDSSLGDTVRLRVAGFRRAEEHAGKPLSIGLNVHYPDASFFAWSSASRGRALNVSSPVAVNVPLSDDGLTLSIDALITQPAIMRTFTKRILNREPSTSEKSVASLGFGSSRDQAKLRSGTYIIAIRESNRDAAPDWSALRYVSSADGVGSVHVAGFLGTQPAPFSYVIITTDSIQRT